MGTHFFMIYQNIQGITIYIIFTKEIPEKNVRKGDLNEIERDISCNYFTYESRFQY